MDEEKKDTHQDVNNDTYININSLGNNYFPFLKDTKQGLVSLRYLRFGKNFFLSLFHII